MFLLSFAVMDIRFIIGKVLGTVLARYRFSVYVQHLLHMPSCCGKCIVFLVHAMKTCGFVLFTFKLK
jgi:hypothetical protein